MIGGAAPGEQSVMLVDFVLSPARRLVLEIAFESVDDVPSAVLSRLRQIGGFKIVDVDFYLSLEVYMRSDESEKQKDRASFLSAARLAGRAALSSFLKVS